MADCACRSFSEGMARGVVKAEWHRVPHPPLRITFRKIKVGSLDVLRLGMVFFRNFEGVFEIARQCTERERKQAGKNSFPSAPFLFARLLGLRPQNFSADGRRDRKNKKRRKRNNTYPTHPCAHYVE